MKIYVIALALLAIYFLGCKKKAVTNGDMICVIYELSNGNGFRIDGSNQPVTPQPLCFVVGNHEVINAIDNAVLGMQIEESKTIIIPPGDAYGERGLHYQDHYGNIVTLVKPNDTLSVWIKIESFR